MESIIKFAYLIAALLFVFGMKRLQSPSTARGGNFIALLGMIVAIVATLVAKPIISPLNLVIGVGIGTIIGMVWYKKAKMTSMPELVAAYNGFGGLASALVGYAEVAKLIQNTGTPDGEALLVSGAVTISLSILIGLVTLTGSFVAFGKLSEMVSGNPMSFPGMRFITLLLFLGSVGGTVWMAMGAQAFPTDFLTQGVGPEFTEPMIWGAVIVGVTAFILGVLLVIPIGGADMPVVVSLLNSYSGLAAGATGFVLNNTALIVSGALVGASGIILSKIMCDAMNRSLLNVLIGGFGGDAGGAAVAASAEGKTVIEVSPEDTAILLSFAEKVIFIPGYGMAVAQAQHAVRELGEELEKRGVTVKYAVHPVAGRMPGHMNVLLAEANVPYDQLYEMDDINSEFDTCDVAVIIGANDVVNPAARHDKASPIYGMPILNADHAKITIVLKRSMKPGYAGIENELFYNKNNRMLFGDAKASITKVVHEVKILE